MSLAFGIAGRINGVLGVAAAPELSPFPSPAMTLKNSVTSFSVLADLTRPRKSVAAFVVTTRKIEMASGTV